MAEHVHELRLLRVWDLGIVAKCDVLRCSKSLGIMDVNSMLNKHANLEQTNADLLEALEKVMDHLVTNNPMGLMMRKIGDEINEAIRKAKSHADTLKGE